MEWFSISRVWYKKRRKDVLEGWSAASEDHVGRDFEENVGDLFVQLVMKDEEEEREGTHEEHEQNNRILR